MAGEISFNSLLVPIDFSPASQAAFDQAVQLASGENPVVILLHVLDPSLVEFASAHGFGTQQDVTRQMRQRAEQLLAECKQRADAAVEVDTIVSEGVPFLEILKKAEDFVVDAIVVGKVGTRGKVEKLLFGSTAEKVLRGSSRPVLVLPLVV